MLQEIRRRKQGEFFTPTIWVDKAHEYISSVFGEDWKEKYVVWDPAWGTGNLTRDYKFKELYVSTLNQSDIDTANQMGYNSEAVKFQFDFLNDPDEKLPESLRKVIDEGREIIVLMNPPYATDANYIGENKNEASNTNINKNMVIENWGKSAQNLYTQFLYRITKINIKNKNIKIGIFCPSLFLTGTSFKEFRKKFLIEFGFEKGFLFEAKHFNNVSKNWGINFICFSNIINNNKITLDVYDCNKNFELVRITEKELYHLDNKITASEWVRTEVKNVKTHNDITFKSCLEIYRGSDVRGRNINNSLGYLFIGGNNINTNPTNVSLYSKPYYNANGLSLIPENFKKCVSLFTARKVINKNWINSKDEYLAPYVESNNYLQYTYDSVIYSIFNNCSFQSSLRQITYKDKLWDIKNEFFWMSKEEMLELSNKNNYSDLYNDARTDSDRHVYKLLFGEERIYDKLSPDAKLVLDKATELVRKSMSMREIFANDENHLKSWDSGYAQLKLIWKEHYVDEFKEFRKLYKNLEDRMRPLVYELGFLMK